VVELHPFLVFASSALVASVMMDRHVAFLSCLKLIDHRLWAWGVGICPRPKIYFGVSSLLLIDYGDAS
jgi:hypothetical protein